MNKKLLGLSDMSIIGSGYLNIFVPLMQGLAQLDYEIKILGIGYKGEQHPYDFSIIPVASEQEVYAVAQNIYNGWDRGTDIAGFDAMVVALDIPMQERILQRMKPRPFKYVGIMPIESIPLTFSWAMVLMDMDKQFIISQFGTDECLRRGVRTAEHLPVGIDAKAWRHAEEKEVEALKTNFGFEKDTFVVLTVADNQERKNLARGMEIFADFLYQTPYVNKEMVREKKLAPQIDARYVLVTREHLSVGWKLYDYAEELGITNHFIVIERGIPFNQLWGMYSLADVFLLPSKCEGLGMPLLEAMACKLPVLATNCTGMKELLADGRGVLLDYVDDPDLDYIDPFGCSLRYFVKRSDGYEKLTQLWKNGFDTDPAWKYVQERTWDKAIELMDGYFRSLDE